MRIIGTSSNGGSKESIFYSNINRARARGDKTSFQGRHGSLHGGHHQHGGKFHGGGRGNFRGRGSCGGQGESYGGQQPNIDSNYYYYGKHGTWPINVIKGSMMHEMKSYNKGIMHELAIKVMSNCL
jgi:hypothetical protein